MKKTIQPFVLSLSALTMTWLMSPEVAHANLVGEEKLIIVERDLQGTVLSYRLNPYYEENATTYKRFIEENREFHRQVYYPDAYSGGKHRDLPTGFVWYSITPQNQEANSYLHDLSVMPENRQNEEGHGGDHLVSGELNVKKGAVNPLTQQYLGNNTGTKVLNGGKYKGERYEYRFIGYNSQGSVVGNPYFPADVKSKALDDADTPKEVSQYFASRNWIKHSWTLDRSIDLFGKEDQFNRRDLKISWINEYFFKQYPEFKKKGNAEYWADRLRPLTDPTKEMGVWVGWHQYPSGAQYYATFITPAPQQPNLRMTRLSVFDEDNTLVATAYRNGSNNDNIDVKETFHDDVLRKGETYRVVAQMKNMGNPDGTAQDVKDMPIQTYRYVKYDRNIGNIGGYAGGRTLINDDNNLSVFEVEDTTTFTYDYTVPQAKVPKQHIEISAEIPGKYFDAGYNTIRDDDLISLQFELPKENLRIEFAGYHDSNREPTKYVNVGHQMWAKYKVTKTEGVQDVKLTRPDGTIDIADINVLMSDLDTSERTYGALDFEQAYKKDGTMLTDDILVDRGDYAYFWASLKPNVAKLCTKASIPSKWGVNGLNNDPSDDVANPPCLVNPDNIIVSDVDAKPETLWLGPDEASRRTAINVNFNLTNHAYDKRTKTIRVVYFVNGRKVKEEQETVPALTTIPITTNLGAFDLGTGEHEVRVEANPIIRDYKEVKINADGTVSDNPYADNGGFDMVNVEKRKDTVFCELPYKKNEWSKTFTEITYRGYRQRHTGNNWGRDKDGNPVITGTYKYYTKETSTSRQYLPREFYERHYIDKVLFKSKETNYSWRDITSGVGDIKAGYGFEMKIITRYMTNTYNQTPKHSYNYGWRIGNYRVRITPTFKEVENKYQRIKLTLPMGEDYVYILSPNQVGGTWYNRTLTYELEPRKVMSQVERKIYVDETTKDGSYNFRIETEPMYGSEDKPAISEMLCDVVNVTVRVKGSYQDDITTHIVQ